MVLISPHRRTDRTSLGPLVGGTFIGTVLVAVGLSLAYITFATPLLHRLLPSGRPDTGQTLVGMAIWALALVGPAGCVLLGTSRLARVAAAVRGGPASGRGPLAPSQRPRTISSSLAGSDYRTSGSSPTS